MHKFLFTQIEGKSLSIDYLEVQSYEMNVYLVYLTVGTKVAWCTISKTDPCVFSVQAKYEKYFLTAPYSRPL